MSIGPSLPPHLQRLRSSEENDDEDDDNDIGPRLPEQACRGPKIIAGETESSDSEDDFGPALPPHLANRETCPGSTTKTEEDSDSDDAIIGPLPPKPGEQNSFSLAQISDIERRAQNMKDKIEGKDKEDMKRETWMLELPSAKAKSFGLGPRTFSRKGVTQVGDRSAWTDTPEEREKRARGEIEETVADEDEKEYLINKSRDESMAKVSQELKMKRGTDSLLEIHEKKQKKSKKSKNEPTERRPFDRDLDLGANKFDEAQRKLMIKKAAQIDSRFSSGSQKFL